MQCGKKVTMSGEGVSKPKIAIVSIERLREPLPPPPPPPPPTQPSSPQVASSSLGAPRLFVVAPRVTNPLFSHSKVERIEALRRMRRESERLKTFKKEIPTATSIEIAAPEEVAKAGFFFLTRDQRVQCAFCLGVLHRISLGKKPLEFHAMYFPSCPFVRNPATSGNIPLDPATNTDVEVDPSQVETPSWIVQRLQAQLLAQQMKAVERLGTMGVEFRTNFPSTPAWPAYVTIESRLRTFSTWPPNLSRLVNPFDMADAGFVKIGFGDTTRCFYCNGGLSGWIAGGDPMSEHAKWFPNCGYLVMVKGREWIQTECETNNPELPLQRSLTPPLLAHRQRDQEQQTSPPSSRLSLVPPTPLIDLSEPLDASDIGGLPANKKARTESDKAGTSSSVCNEVLVEEPTPFIIHPPSKKKIPTNGGRHWTNTCCKVCTREKVSIVVLPCGHLSTCERCSLFLPSCPICKGPFSGYVRVHLVDKSLATLSRQKETALKRKAGDDHGNDDDNDDGGNSSK